MLRESDRPQRDLSVSQVAQLPLTDEAEVLSVEGVLAQDHLPHQGAHDHRVAVGQLSEAVEELGEELSLAARLEHECVPEGDGDAERVAAEVRPRYFVTSIPAGPLSRDQELALVRMHRGIENGCHWTMDVMLGEDDSQPCQASRASIETVSWLRIIGYNAVSAWRQQSPRRDRKPAAWARAMETLRDALLLAEVEHHEAIQGIT